MGRSRRLQACERIRRGLDEHGKARGSRDELLQESELLWRKLRVHCGETGDVAARPIEARDETGLDRVYAGREDDRDRRGRGFGRAGCGRTEGSNDDSRTAAD